MAPVEGDSPAGPDLEYDADFGELDRAANPREGQVVGDTAAPAQEVEWGAVRDMATALLTRSKDLRVAVNLTRALAHTDGWTGFSAGIGLIRGLVEQYWPDVHPVIDPEFEDGAVARINALATLADSERMLRTMQIIPLVELKGVGRFGLRDIAIAEGRVHAFEGENGTVPDPAIIAGAFSDCDADVLTATAAAVDSALGHAKAIEAIVVDHVGTASGVDLSDLRSLLQDVQQTLAPHLERRGVVADTPQQVAAQQAAAADAPAPAPNHGAGVIRTREDVVRVLDSACEYFYRHEPSSPVPLLLRRARRLVTMNFEEIVRDLAPDAVSQVEAIRGDAHD